jgi:hypothetical protein
LRSRVLAALPFALFAVLCALTWKRWLLPFRDHPRELMIPLRVADGELLYRDVGTVYGPLPPLVDAMALRLLGRHLDVLLGVRIAVALMGIEALRRLARRLFDGDANATAAVCVVVATCGFCHGGPWAFPYSVAALEGMVLVLWALELALSSTTVTASLAAGLLAGAAAGMKLELLPAALLVPGPALFLRRPRREAAGAVGLALLAAVASYAGPVLLFGREVIERHGYLIALRAPEPFRRVYEMVLFGGMTPWRFLAGGYLEALLPSLLFFGLAALVLHARAWRWAGGAAASFALGLASLGIRSDEEMNALLPLAVVAALVEAGRLVRAPERGSSTSLAPACLALPMLLLLSRQPFFFRVGVFTAFTAPLALLMALSFLLRRAVPARAAALCAGLVLAQGIDRWQDFHRFEMRTVSFPRGSLALPVETAALVEESVDAIRRLAPRAGTVWAFPEPGFLAFFSERRSAFVDEHFYPGHQDAAGEAEMVARMAITPPDVALVVNRATPEFGEATFGRGVLDRFAEAFGTAMEPVAVLGAARPIPGPGMATEAVVFVPRRGPPSRSSREAAGPVSGSSLR